MSTFKTALKGWLDAPDNKQTDLGEAIGKSQAAVNRYAQGIRFPDAETARAIDKATGGAVPFSLWQREFLERSGLAA